MIGRGKRAETGGHLALHGGHFLPYSAVMEVQIGAIIREKILAAVETPPPEFTRCEVRVPKIEGKEARRGTPRQETASPGTGPLRLPGKQGQ